MGSNCASWVESFFDKINHDRLMTRLSKGIGDKRLLHLIDSFLKAGMMVGGLNNINSNEKFILLLKMQKQTQRRRSLHFSRTHDQNLEVCCRGISFC